MTRIESDMEWLRPDEQFLFVKRLKEAYYMVYPTGGTLHVVLDDGNIEDDYIERCMDEARKEEDYLGYVLGNCLLRLPILDRELI